MLLRCRLGAKNGWQGPRWQHRDPSGSPGTPVAAQGPRWQHRHPPPFPSSRTHRGKFERKRAKAALLPCALESKTPPRRGARGTSGECFGAVSHFSGPLDAFCPIALDPAKGFLAVGLAGTAVWGQQLLGSISSSCFWKRCGVKQSEMKRKKKQNKAKQK